jgi:hypothetical protein
MIRHTITALPVRAPRWPGRRGALMTLRVRRRWFRASSAERERAAEYIVTIVADYARGYPQRTIRLREHRRARGVLRAVRWRFRGELEL